MTTIDAYIKRLLPSALFKKSLKMAASAEEQELTLKSAYTYIDKQHFAEHNRRGKPPASNMGEVLKGLLDFPRIPYIAILQV